jgi:hypothetical protein
LAARVSVSICRLSAVVSIVVPSRRVTVAPEGGDPPAVQAVTSAIEAQTAVLMVVA